MVLEKNIKDIDASVELLMDRKKGAKIWFFLFFITGWITVLISAFYIPRNYDECGIGIGLALLIFATWCFSDMNYYNTLVCLKKQQEKK